MLFFKDLSIRIILNVIKLETIKTIKEMLRNSNKNEEWQILVKMKHKDQELTRTGDNMF